MIGFFQPLGAHGAVSLADIRALGDEEANEHGVMLRTVYLKNPDRKVQTFAHEWHALLERPVQIIPALGGTSIVSWDVSLTPPELWRTPVIAWALCLDGEVRPVTPGGVNDAVHGPTYVEMPGGKIEAVGEWGDPPGFDDAATLIKHFTAQREARANKQGEA